MIASKPIVPFGLGDGAAVGGRRQIARSQRARGSGARDGGVPGFACLRREQADLGAVGRRGRQSKPAAHHGGFDRVGIGKNLRTARLVIVAGIEAVELERGIGPGKAALGDDAKAVVGEAGEIERLGDRAGLEREQR